MDHHDKLYSSYICWHRIRSTNMFTFELAVNGQLIFNGLIYQVLPMQKYIIVFYTLDFHRHIYVQQIVYMLRNIFVVTMVLKLYHRNRKLRFTNFVQPVVSTIGFPCLRIIVYISLKYIVQVGIYGTSNTSKASYC